MKRTLLSRSRLIVILTVVLILAFTFTSVLSYNVTRDSITTSDRTRVLPLISDNIFSEIQQDLIRPINVSSLMAHDEFLIEWINAGEEDLGEVERYLRRIKEEYGYFSSFFISAQTQNYYYYNGILKQISRQDAHDDWYFAFVEKNTDYDLDVDTDEATDGTFTIFINHRLEDQNGTFLGVTGVGLRVDSIGRTLAEYQRKYGSLIYMVDSTGMVQVHPDESLVLSANLQGLDGMAELSEEILTNKAGTNIYEINNGQRQIVLSTRYFPEFDWFLIVARDQTNALKSARRSLLGNFAIGLAVTTLVITLVVLSINLFHDRLNSLAIHDDLTGLHNRRKFQELFQREISMAKRYEQPLSLLLLDVDSFKSVNDQYGHAAGDRYLQALAETLKNEVREIDVVARWGGEEFVVLLPKAGAEQAWLVAERLRKTAGQIQIGTPKGMLTRTVSIGIASMHDSPADMDSMIQQADRAMYRAKVAGRNQTCLAD